MEKPEPALEECMMVQLLWEKSTNLWSIVFISSGNYTLRNKNKKNENTCPLEACIQMSITVFLQ